MDSYRELARVFDALSHPVRLRILQLLAQEEFCVCHLTAALRRRQPYVSQQLAVLRDVGLVLDRRDGLMIHYRLASPRVLDLMEMAADLLRQQGQEIALPPLPEMPVPGCPCPKCAPLAVQANQ